MKAVCAGVAVAAVLLLLPRSSRADPVTDAEVIALELSGELLAPPGLTAEVDGHLQTIRAVEPVLGAVQAYADWEPGVLAVKLTSSAFIEFQSGTYTGLDSLNAAYGPVEVTDVFESVRTIVMEFSQHYNDDLLGAIYGTAPGVYRVDPSWYGNTETDIWSAELATYTFRYSWGDCPLGCTKNHCWTYRIDASGEPLLLDEWGDPLIGVAAPEITEAARLRLDAPHPNPFSRSTWITAAVPSGRGGRLDVINAAGRHVCTLQRAVPGDATVVRWDGCDDNGRAVAGGVYYVLLRSPDGGRITQRVAVVR